jgi:hypothetical protein
VPPENKAGVSEFEGAVVRNCYGASLCDVCGTQPEGSCTWRAYRAEPRTVDRKFLWSSYIHLDCCEPGVPNLFKTEGRIRTFLSTRGPQDYK